MEEEALSRVAHHRDEFVVEFQVSEVAVAEALVFHVGGVDVLAAPHAGEVIAAAFLGSHNEYLVEAEGVRVQIWAFGNVLLHPGTRVTCSIAPEHLLVLDAE